MYAPEVNVRVFPGLETDSAQLALQRLAVAEREEPRAAIRPTARRANGTLSFIPVEFIMFCASMGVFVGLYLWSNGRLQPAVRVAQALLGQVGLR
ncbi:MAG TPA: hypothetical protein VD837_01630 [Terriglobales bacterium]|nr:hypothetical protein [Terriglobales bacterium]